MSLREKMNERPSLAIAVGFGLIVVAVAAVLLSRGGSASSSPSRGFYSDDDGSTWFADDRAKLPPFDHGGKQAVRAYVFRAGTREFVNHLERYTPDGVKLAKEAAAASSAGRAPPRSTQAVTEVKRPGDAAWVPTNDMARASSIMTVKLPAGASGEPVEVEP